MSVFDSIVGQTQAIETLKKASIAAKNQSSNQEMTHSWLFVGPPGSGRSNLAIAFATSLICPNNGCGDCTDCTTARLGNHPDIEIFATEGISIKVDDIRELVARGSWGASLSPFRVVVIEDCDRMTESAANALLKSIEEPGSQTVWLLCAPSIDEVLPTIRSRCRLVSLRTPTTHEISKYLISELNIDTKSANQIASISQGHIGRAKYFATNPQALKIRTKVLKLFISIKTEPNAIKVAAELLELATTSSELRTQEADQKEEELLKITIQGPNRAFLSGGSKALKELEKSQKLRTTRTTRDEIDSYLLYLQSFLRDAISLNQSNPDLIINSDMTKEISDLISNTTPEKLGELTLKINQYRFNLDSNSAQLLILESVALNFLSTIHGN